MKISLLKFCWLSPFVFLLLVANSASGGPSFDCANARTWSEQYICQDAQLATLDREMAELYRTLQNENSGRVDELKATQHTWLKQREQCRSTKEPKTCLVEHYQQRIAELKDNSGIYRNRVRGPALSPAVVWDHSDMIYQQCDIPDFDCVLRLMQSSGASPEAMAFLQREEAWVVEFTEYGQTDLLRLETFRANTNQFYALASQAEGVVVAEGYDLTKRDQQRSEVQAVLRQHPQAFFIAKPTFVRHEAGVNGGSRFVFADFLADCRACEPLATGKLIYVYDAAWRQVAAGPVPSSLRGGFSP